MWIRIQEALEYGYNTDPDPQHWLTITIIVTYRTVNLILLSLLNIIFVYGIPYCSSASPTCQFSVHFIFQQYVIPVRHKSQDLNMSHKPKRRSPQKKTKFVAALWSRSILTRLRLQQLQL